VRRWLALAACLPLAACATVPQPAGLAPGAHYVALGSSYAAGAGIPPLATDRPARCGTSQLSYSRLLAARLGLSLTDASCGGATTAHVMGAWNELPAQIDAVRADTRLVTITIGGNDLNYMGVMFAASCHAGVRDARSLDPATGQCRPVPIPDPAAYQAVEESLTTVLQAVRARAPQARVILVQYLALAPDENCPAAALRPQHFAAARNLAQGLARASERAAERAGAQVLAMDQISLGHTPCDTQPWAHGYSQDYDASQGSPWHPNAAGHAAVAAELAAMLDG
jgi:lysophospholipase L1-like esterase